MKYLLLLLLVGCIPVPYEAAVISLPAEHYSMGADAARTLCAINNVPIIVIDPKIVGSLAEPVILEHERVHVKQLTTYSGGCHQGLKKYVEDPETRFKWESEAYCATIDKAKELNFKVQTIEENIRTLVRTTFNRPLVCSVQGTAQQFLGINRGG